ncbi:pyruvate dehydrogenase complex dihydrolipoamide acetyltransferase [Rhodovibrio salinarum]|uniref:Acetyltransferase component of pyruvate dehydrogenase complex n=1 Tax=Rhodovibrio salinarum TaxID=1087 RepID=A0A934QJZ9_9PROT|nr:pyruvate dehydrogenase complex dihydrolipoamide acetyltransferase [Rhodovibrio salinarum]MBK1697845.1 pyruvate dehydrogenase complex dihydrolipoamide acetyltransferase [Rhodovibrio salinarum]
MPVNILMPALSPTMTEGNLAKWHVKPGDTVSSGDVVAEIETDKATMEVEAVDEGTVGKILVEEGTEGVPVNQAIAILLQEGESEADLDKAPEPPAAPAGDDGGSDTQPDASEGSSAPAPQQASSAPGTQASLENAPPAPPAPKDASGNRVFASPLARRMAKQAGLDLASLKGTGPHGRIVRADVEQAIERGAPAQQPAAQPQAQKQQPAPQQSAPAQGVDAKASADSLGMAYEEVPLNNMRKTIAKRLSESKQTVPHFYLSVDVEMDAVFKVRKELNDRAQARGEDYKLSVNDFIIRACALALKKVPQANAAFNGASALFFEHADISVAVAIEGGLITPVIKQAETKGLATISTEMKDLAKRARDGKLKPEEYQGGTFSLSNLGMFGITNFQAIINPPQACILAVGKSEQRPVVKDGALSVATMMSCTLSVDHRVVDGAIGANFLSELQKLLEDPMSMLL